MSRRRLGGRLLFEWRTRTGRFGTRSGDALTQLQAAVMIGVGPAHWCTWERGRKTPNRRLGARITGLTGIPAEAWDQFEDEDEEPEAILVAG